MAKDCLFIVGNQECNSDAKSADLGSDFVSLFGLEPWLSSVSTLQEIGADLPYTRYILTYHLRWTPSTPVLSWLGVPMVIWVRAFFQTDQILAYNLQIPSRAALKGGLRKSNNLLEAFHCWGKYYNITTARSRQQQASKSAGVSLLQPGSMKRLNMVLINLLPDRMSVTNQVRRKRPADWNHSKEKMR